ncbi:MAG: Adenylosuccinate lyase [Bacteroidia bacterium]|nr:Adenylosuccinate lyase [Bacteroidia bacterium]
MTKNFSPLTAISPVDGRYHKQTAELSQYFSEYALMQYRVKVEVEYFIALCKLPLPQLKGVNKKLFPKMQDVYKNFTEKDAEIIKDTEKTTNHDVKAVEYFVKAKFEKLGLKNEKEFVHFGLTSQDINNTATPAMMRDATLQIWLPALLDVVETLERLSNTWENIPMLAHTHGQPASPTRLGKELNVFTERLMVQLEQPGFTYAAKFGGATGNLNAHYVAYPKTDWTKFANKFITELGLVRSQTTTQIEHYDNIAAWCDSHKRINTILIDLCRDMWAYISMDYFKQKIKAGEIGSSAMPHKVNPIDFENAEGNLGFANAMFEHFAAKLPISRLQRDLTDSTVLRNIGMPLAHTLIAFKSVQKGLDKLVLNKEAIDRDLENNWAVVAEALQTILRREGYKNPYETLKDLTRKNEKISKESIAAFIKSLSVSDKVKKEMLAITPFNYTGK